MTRRMNNAFAEQESFQAAARSIGVLSMWAVFSLISALVLAGCSSEPSPVALPKLALNPVKGKVLTADGKPVSEGLVTFVPNKPDITGGTAKIESDGSFTAKTGDRGEGLAEGEYKVKIESDLTVPGAKAGATKALVPVEYLDEQSSNLTVTIKSGSNDLAPFKLVPVPKSARKATTRPVTGDVD
ncbi:MAG: hypothetical protein JWN86_4263 [Planctomycetota bacterium]|nr:hypothetical protein [Planctomycetota bacterium]